MHTHTRTRTHTRTLTHTRTHERARTHSRTNICTHAEVVPRHAKTLEHSTFKQAITYDAQDDSTLVLVAGARTSIGCHDI